MMSRRFQLQHESMFAQLFSAVLLDPSWWNSERVSAVGNPTPVLSNQISLQLINYNDQFPNNSNLKNMLYYVHQSNSYRQFGKTNMLVIYSPPQGNPTDSQDPKCVF